MSNLIAAVILAVCLPNSDHCELEIPAQWRNPTSQDLAACADHAEILISHGADARCEVADVHSLADLPADPAQDPIEDLADRAAVEEFLRPLVR